MLQPQHAHIVRADVNQSTSVLIGVPVWITLFVLCEQDYITAFAAASAVLFSKWYA